MKEEVGTAAESAPLDLGQLAHQLRGLCGLLNLVAGEVPKGTDVREVFEGALKRMNQIIATVDEARHNGT